MQSRVPKSSDSDLLRAVARGDESALADLYDRYRLILFSLTFRILHDRAEAEDTLQDVFLQIWRRAKDFDENRGRAFSWLVTIARSRALDRLRALGSRARVDQQAVENAGSEVPDANSDAQQSEEAAIVRRALAELSEDQRQALFLAYFQGMTQTEIANYLNKPLGTVKTRMRSGMIKLRELLRDVVDKSI